MSIAIFGGGCFWCTEAVFNNLAGVQKVDPGYCGGDTASPSYEEVCSGRSGHVEVIAITYDAKLISFGTLLDVFFATHDPTTLDRQGNDVGPQYQSVIFAQDEDQAKLAKKKIQQIDESREFGAPIVTKVLSAQTFWPAETVHHGYYESNPNQGYCQYIIAPKVRAMRQQFKELLRT